MMDEDRTGADDLCAGLELVMEEERIGAGDLV